MEPSLYVYQEFPKCLYQANGLTVTVASIEDQLDMAALGWMTAEQFHGTAEITAPSKVPVPVGDVELA